MKNLFQLARIHHQKFWIRENLVPTFLSIGLFSIALWVQRLANDYVLGIKGTAVNDILLNHLPSLKIDFLIIQVPLLVTFLALGLIIYKPHYFLFTVESLSLFLLVRSFFISLTHLGANPEQIVLNTHTFGFSLYNILYNTNNDFFFSGHTGIPVLLALIFWSDRHWRYLFLGIAVLFGISVLLAHLHYSIDVFAAPFMTYSIFTLAKYIFPRSYGLTRNG